MTALRAEAAIDTAIFATAVFRVLSFIRLQGWFNSHIPSYENFIQVVRANKLYLPPANLAIFTIRDTDVCRFEARVAPCGMDHRWLKQCTWGRACDRDGRFTTTMRILKLLGSRASLALAL